MVGNKNFTDVTKPSEIVQLLLNDDQLANLDTSTAPGLSSSSARKQLDGPTDSRSGPVRDLWNDEGDDFFGQAGLAGVSASGIDGLEEDNGTPIPSATRGHKRKSGAGQASRPRKSASGKKKSGTTTGNATPMREEL